MRPNFALLFIAIFVCAEKQPCTVRKNKKTCVKTSQPEQKDLTEVGFEPTPEDQYLKLAP